MLAERILLNALDQRGSIARVPAPPAGGALETVEELPGYLLFTGLFASSLIVDSAGRDTRARMFLQIPDSNGRDLDDLVIETRIGEEWLRCRGFLFRPQATVSMLVLGANAVTIGTGRGPGRMA